MKNSNKKTSEKETSEQIGAELETAQTETTQAPLRKINANKDVSYTDVEWLEKENPLDYVGEDVSSSKFEEEREKNVQKGLPILASISINGVAINKLLILLGKWWEVKPARNAIKKLIDEEAFVKGMDSAVYLQVELAKQVDIFAEMGTALDRIKYAKTYYKPRKPLSEKIITKLLSIDNVVYVVPVMLLEEAKIKFIGDKEGLIAEIKSFSTLRKDEIEEL